MSVNDTLRPIVAVDGTVWDGSLNIVLGGILYYGSPRTVNVVRKCPVFNHDYAIADVLYEGTEMEVYGWVRKHSYMNDDRFWVRPDGGHIPVYATAEKPV